MATGKGKTNGMGILNNIPRKNPPPITGQVFTMRTAGHDTLIGFEGLDYNAPFTESGTPPLLGQFNTATQPQLPALQAESPGVVVPQQRVVRVNPNQRTVLHTTGKPQFVVQRTGGPSPNSDTPFHPNQQRQGPRPTTYRKGAVTTEKAKAASYVATGATRSKTSVSGHVAKVVGSYLPTGTGTLSQHAHADSSKSRWNTVKRGAAG